MKSIIISNNIRFLIKNSQKLKNLLTIFHWKYITIWGVEIYEKNKILFVSLRNFNADFFIQHPGYGKQYYSSK